MDNKTITSEQMWGKYRPLGMWEYFLYSILFSIPVVGFILLVVFSFDGSNINRRNYARSFFCGTILLLVIVAIFLANGVFGIILRWLGPDDSGVAVTILNTVL